MDAFTQGFFDVLKEAKDKPEGPVQRVISPLTKAVIGGTSVAGGATLGAAIGAAPGVREGIEAEAVRKMKGSTRWPFRLMIKDPPSRETIAKSVRRGAVKGGLTGAGIVAGTGLVAKVYRAMRGGGDA